MQVFFNTRVTITFPLTNQLLDIPTLNVKYFSGDCAPCARCGFNRFGLFLVARYPDVAAEHTLRHNIQHRLLEWRSYIWFKSFNSLPNGLGESGDYDAVSNFTNRSDTASEPQQS
jgi:hypothetical protein